MIVAAICKVCGSMHLMINLIDIGDGYICHKCAEGIKDIPIIKSYPPVLVKKIYIR